MTHFGVTLKDKVCMDVGASTGGFTDCMLQNGAVKVYAVDVGYGQLAWSLRTDARVVNMERTNIRYVTPEDLAEPIEFFSVDVSFISLHHIFPVAQRITTPDAMGVCLVKPQFEAGREKVGKNGVVRDPAVHRGKRLCSARVGLQPGQRAGRQYRVPDVCAEERPARSAGRRSRRTGGGSKPHHAGSLRLQLSAKEKPV